jgi:hypothetical protein
LPFQRIRLSDTTEQPTEIPIAAANLGRFFG